MKRAKIGSISHGTMRPEDLIPVFTDTLETLARANRRYGKVRALLQSAISAPDSETLNDLHDALDTYAPPYCYFGANPGDGSDYGFWIHESIQYDFDGITVEDTSDIPRGYRGEVLHINDHGNMALYVATARKLREVWAVV